MDNVKKWTEENKKLVRNFIAALFITIILVTVMYVWIRKDSILRNEVVVKYSDDCIEKYVNAILVTPKCNVTEKQDDRWILPINLSLNLNLSQQ